MLTAITLPVPVVGSSLNLAELYWWNVYHRHTSKCTFDFPNIFHQERQGRLKGAFPPLQWCMLVLKTLYKRHYNEERQIPQQYSGICWKTSRLLNRSNNSRCFYGAANRHACIVIWFSGQGCMLKPITLITFVTLESILKLVLRKHLPIKLCIEWWKSNPGLARSSCSNSGQVAGCTKECQVRQGFECPLQGRLKAQHCRLI